MKPRAERFVEGLGRVLYFSGIFLFPFSLGGVLGFYAADQGVPWLPDMISGVLSGSLLAMVLIMVGRWLLGRVHVESPEGRRLSRRMLLAISLTTVGVGMRLWVYWAEQPAPLTLLQEDDFEEAWAVDARSYQDQNATLDALLARLERHAMFDGDRVLSPDEEQLILSSWRIVYDSSFALEGIRVFYEDWYRFDPSRAQRSYHLRSFLLASTSELALIEKGLRFTKLVKQNADAEKFLNGPHPQLGLPENSISIFREEVLGTRDQGRILAGERYMDFLGGPLHGRSEARAAGAGWLWDSALAHRRALDELGFVDRTALGVRGELQPLKRVVRRTWYPTQKGVAEWFGDTKTRRIGNYLISEEQSAEAAEQLLPGDVLLSRKNWYLSNIGLPGFWPHALLYVGDPEQFRVLGEDPEVQEFLVGRSLDDFMVERHGARWGEYLVGDDHPYRVIEAVSEGVVLNTLEHAAGDYLAGLRPRLTPLERLLTIDAAFSSLGKPYDFDFDFATDNALVCTELVWRSLRPQGIDWTLEEVAGRRTLPANAMVQQWAESRGTPEQSLDFVLFYDAREKLGAAVPVDEEELAASHARVKWDVAQQ